MFFGACVFMTSNKMGNDIWSAGGRGEKEGEEEKRRNSLARKVNFNNVIGHTFPFVNLNVLLAYVFV